MPGNRVREFLEDTLVKLGLQPTEYQDFIVYWYPRLKDYPLLHLYFAHGEYDQAAPLRIKPTPDSVLRVFMIARPIEKGVNVTEQKLAPFIRKGFAVVEWGGMLSAEETTHESRGKLE